MSTNPFRQSLLQQAQVAHDSHNPNTNRLVPSSVEPDDINGLTIDTRVDNGRHVSFASPPVDSTIPAFSYPSSPESARSPVQQVPETYHNAFSSDPFAGLGIETRQDPAILEALHNTQNNAVIGTSHVIAEKDAIRATLGRFAGSKLAASQPQKQARQSMDVDAFARLLLTGDKQQDEMNDSISSIPAQGTEVVSSTDEKLRIPPPRPAPRRVKSTRSKPTEDSAESAVTGAPQGDITSPGILSQPIQAGQSAPVPVKALPPPPPPMRRQASTSNRRSSTELATTIEESETHTNNELPVLLASSRRSSDERPRPPASRNSSSSMKRQSMLATNPPPLPPPRRGRGSSRSSVDSFRPSLAAIMGEAEAEEHQETPPQTMPPSAQDILAELALLKRDVDAARRGA